MKDFNKIFKEIYGKKELSNAVLNATERAIRKRMETLKEIPDFESKREAAKIIRDRSIKDQKKLLEQFENKAKKNGFEVFYASDKDDALKTIDTILQNHNVQRIIKGKSMVTEEIDLREFLQKRGYEIYETDLGEFIIQLANEKPSHLTGPAIHKNRFEIAHLLTEKIGIPYTTSPEELTSYVRKFLREKFLTADAGITGANFLIADRGGLILLENEANIRLTTTLPSIHIAITGIEKIVSSLEELAPILRILPPSSTGQLQTGYVNFIQNGEKPKRYIIIIDNGRSKMLIHPRVNEALRCIRCGACANVCPVFQLVGGHAYGGVYSGAMGIIWNTYIYGNNETGNLPYLCTLCGACEEVCPVKIPLPDLILELRRENFNSLLSKEEKFIIKIWKLSFTSDLFSQFLKGVISILKIIQKKRGKISFLPFTGKKWTKGRDLKLR